MTDGIHYQCHTIFKRNIETGHAHIGNGKFLRTIVTLIDKEGNYGTTGTHHIAIANYGKLDVLGTADIIGSSEEFVGGEFGSTIQVNGRTSLVGRKSDHMLHTRGQSCFYDVLSTVHVSFNTLFGIIFSGIYLLNGSSMNNHIHTFASTRQAFKVTDISDKKRSCGYFFAEYFCFNSNCFSSSRE